MNFYNTVMDIGKVFDPVIDETSGVNCHLLF